MMRFFRLPRLKIHVWGGLGSQLHAWHLYEFLARTNPNRRFVMVFHSSGVTRRLPEIIEYLPKNSSIIVDDYIRASQFAGKSRKKFSAGRYLFDFVKLVASPFLINQQFDTRLKISPLRFWNLAIRGHYSGNEIDQVALGAMATKLGLNVYPSLEVSSEHTLVVHIRLGDLLELENKFPTDVQLAAMKILEIVDSQNIERVRVHSDSPEVARKLINEYINCPLNIAEVENPLAALFEFIQADFFLGTSSKLGIWAAVFRDYLGKSHTYLPANLKPNYMLLASSLEKSQPHFY